MASGWYKPFKEKCLLGTAPSLDSETAIDCYLIDVADYSVDLAAHDFLDDVPSGARVAGPVTITSTTVNVPEGGVFDGANITFTSVTGDPCEALVICVDSGAEATSDLVLYIDGISVSPNGGDIAVTWDNGTSRIAKL